MSAIRAYVALDVSNLWKSCKEQFGREARIDFQILSQFVPSRLRPEEVSQELVAYIVTNPKQRHHAFYAALRNYGYRVQQRYMKYDKADRPTRTDWDVGITIDAIDRIDSYDLFVLASGDGDFSQLLSYLHQRQKKTMVLSFENSTAKSLYKTADQLITLTEDVVF